MRQRFGFDLSMEAVRLMKRGDGFWYEEAVEKIEGSDILERLEALVATVPAGEPVEIFLPGDQILYVDVPILSEESAAADIRAALDGRTPYAIEELEFDWEPTTPGLARVAALARDTLDEAAAFAEARGLTVSRYSSLAEPQAFPRLPDFGSSVEDWAGPDAADPALVLVGQAIPDETEGAQAASAQDGEDDAGDSAVDVVVEPEEAAETDPPEQATENVEDGQELLSDTEDDVAEEVDDENVFVAGEEIDGDVAEPESGTAEEEPHDQEGTDGEAAVPHDFVAEPAEQSTAEAEAEAEAENVGEENPDSKPSDDPPLFHSARKTEAQEDVAAEDPPTVEDPEPAETAPVIEVHDATPVIATRPIEEPPAPQSEDLATPAPVAASLTPERDPLAGWNGRETSRKGRSLAIAASIATVATFGIGWIVWSIMPEPRAVPEVTTALTAPAPETQADAILPTVEETPPDRAAATPRPIGADETLAQGVDLPDLPQPVVVTEAPAGEFGNIIADDAAFEVATLAGVARQVGGLRPDRPFGDAWNGPGVTPEATPDAIRAASSFLIEGPVVPLIPTESLPVPPALSGFSARPLAAPYLPESERETVFASLSPLPDELSDAVAATEMFELSPAAELPVDEADGAPQLAEEDVGNGLPAPTELARNLTAIPPSTRPSAIVERFERLKFGGRTRQELSVIRPGARPASAQSIAIAALAEAGPAAGASLASLDQSLVAGGQPRTRPDDFDATVRDVLARQATLAPPPDTSAAVRAALARPPEAENSAVENARSTSRMVIPSGVNVARRATIENAIDMGRLALVGIYGSTSDRRALLRLSNGRYVKVKAGDKVDGGTIAAINANSITYRKGGRNQSLMMPGG